MIYAFVPARSGSTRLKNKNIKKLNNRPLIYYTVKVAIESKFINKVIFSSDSIYYYNKLVHSLEKDQIPTTKLVFDLREKKYSSSKFKIFDYFKILFLDSKKFDPNDIVVQLLPTCPLRTKKTLNEVIKTSVLEKRNYFTATNYNFHISFAFSISKNSWKSYSKNNPMIKGNTRGQDQIKYFYPNGSIYVIHIKNLKFSQKTFYENAKPYLMKANESLDIDDIDDFNLASKIISKS